MTQKEKFYRAYMDFFETAERKRRWNMFEDVPWDQISPQTNTEERAIRIETYCAEEMYLPDYNIAGVEMAEDRAGTLRDLAYVIANFRMPGDGLIPNYLENLKIGGGGISPRLFFTRAIMPILKQLGTSREELKESTPLPLRAVS